MNPCIKKGLKTHKGYSLIELVVTLAILTIIATPLAGFFVVGAKNNEAARDQMRAGVLAQSTMENWKQQAIIDALDPSPYDDPTGRFTIDTVAAVVTHTIAGNDQELGASGDPPPAPVSAKIEDYKYAANDALAGDIALTITGATGNFVMNVQGTSYPVPDTFDLDIKVNPATEITGFVIITFPEGGGPSVPHSVPYNRSEASLRVVITACDGIKVAMSIASEERTIADATQYAQDTQVYVIDGYDSGSGDKRIDTDINSDHVVIYDNIQAVPESVVPENLKLNRLYQLTVTVTRKGGSNPLAQLTSYKRIE